MSDLVGGILDFLGLTGPTDFLLKKCRIISADGKPMEFRLTSAELNYYEDLFGNSCSGNIILSDSNNQQADKSFCGDEFLQLELFKPGQEDSSPLKKYCRIYNMEDRNLTKDSNENFILNFSTEEIFLSEQYRVSKSYKQKRIDQIVEDIAKTYLKIKDPIDIIKTLGKYDIIVPNLKPMEAINWLCTLAICEDTRIPGSSYLFYQDKDKWNFKPLVAIYGDYSKYGQYYDKYWYGVKNDGETEMSDPSGWETKNIISYQILNNYDALEATQDGVYANRMLYNDNKKRLHEQAIFDYEKYFNEKMMQLSLYKGFHPYHLMSTAKDRFNKKHNEVPDTVLKMGFRTKDNRVEITVPHRYVQLRLASAIRLKVAVPGDTNLTIGMVVYIDLRAPGPVQASNTEPVKKIDKFYAGRYLITALHHRIDQEQNFETTMELCKDSYVSSVSSMDMPGLNAFTDSEDLMKARSQGTF